MGFQPVEQPVYRAAGTEAGLDIGADQPWPRGPLVIRGVAGSLITAMTGAVVRMTHFGYRAEAGASAVS